jgi:hypothetical protein
MLNFVVKPPSDICGKGMSLTDLPNTSNQFACVATIRPPVYLDPKVNFTFI